MKRQTDPYGKAMKKYSKGTGDGDDDDDDDNDDNYTLGLKSLGTDCGTFTTERLLLTSVPRVGAKKRSTNNSRGFNVSLSSGTSANVCPSLTFAFSWLNNGLPWTSGSGNSTFLKSKLPLTSFCEKKKNTFGEQKFILGFGDPIRP